MSDGHFFTFPLCLLAMDLDYKTKLQTIVAHSMERAGNSDTKIEPARLKASAKTVRGYCGSSAQHKAILRGAVICGVMVRDMRNTAGAAARARAFVADHEKRFGVEPLVFISAALLWGATSHDDPNERLFTTLCAVNSVIGFKPTPVLIRRSMIQARQLGYKSPTVMKIGIRETQKPLTTQQLRDCLSQLEVRELVFRCHASRRNTYFSTVTSGEGLRDAVARIKAARDKVQLQRQTDRNRFHPQEPERNHLKRKPPIEPEKEPLKKEGPNENQNGTTTGTTRGTTTGTTKTNAFKQMPLNKSFETKEVLRADAPLSSEDQGSGAKSNELPKPTLADVEGFFGSLKKQAEQHATDWLSAFGDDERWSGVDWKAHASRWLFDKISRLRNESKREAMATA